MQRFALTSSSAQKRIVQTIKGIQMELLEPKLKVAPTALLVLQHARSLYDSGLTKTYFDKIDFREVEELSAHMQQAYKDFTQTVLYRKRFIRHLLEDYLEIGCPVQVCILGAGLDPLSLYLLEEYRGAVSGIFEVDQHHVNDKKKLYPASDLIHFIQADITDTLHLPDRLRDAGYQPEMPVIIILEGVFHYISDTRFLNIMQFFRTPNKTNVLIMDYMLPEECLQPDTAIVFRELRQLLETFIGGAVHVYSRQQIFSLVDVLQGDVAGVASMQEVEYRLNGRNELYYAEGEGFIEMISCYI